MSDKKQHHTPLTVEEQVENLKKLGLIINDDEYAKRLLNDVKT